MIKDFEIRDIKSINKKELGKNLEYKLPKPIKLVRSTLNKSAEKHKASLKTKESPVKKYPKKEAKKTSINILPKQKTEHISKQIINKKSLPVKQEHKTLVIKPKPLVKKDFNYKKMVKLLPKKSHKKNTKISAKDLVKEKLLGRIDKRYFTSFGTYSIAKDPDIPKSSILENTPRISKVVYNSISDNLLKTWRSTNNNIFIVDNKIIFPSNSDGAVELTGVSLPYEYEIAFKLDCNKLNGDIEFGVTAEEYLPGLY